MTRRGFVCAMSLVGVGGFGGCFAPEASNAIVDRFDCEQVRRPTPDVDAGIEHVFEYPEGDELVYESVGSASYPAPPTSADVAQIESFVSDHEAAFQQNRLVDRYGAGLSDFAFGVDRLLTVDHRRSIDVIRIDFYLFDETFTDEGEPVVGHAEGGAIYGVDETGAVRVEADYHAGLDDEAVADAPDPLETGTLVDCFGQN